MNENVTVCITPKGDKPVLHFSQFDNERVFTVTVLADDGESAAILTGLDIEFRLRKTDSHVITIAPESVADNVITFKTTEQLCACCGQNIASVVLMKYDMIISTLDILVDIQRDILSGGLTSESDIRNLNTQIEQIVPEVVGDDYYNKQEVDDLLAEHTFDPANYYDKSDVDGLLADKADSDDVYTKAETDNLLADKADKSAIASLIVQKDVAKAPIASFNTDLAEALTKIIVDINPVQDLHGYSKPWSGGGGKNKYCDIFSQYTRPFDYRLFPITLTQGQTYKLWASLKGSAVSGCTVGIIKDGTKYGDFFGFKIVINSSGRVFTLPSFTVDETFTNPKLVVYADTETDFNSIFANYNVQLEVGSQATAYEPYSNICPISGFSALNVTLADGDMQTVESKTVNFGQTVYGGVADVTNGKVTVTHGFVNLGDLSWSGSNGEFYSGTLTSTIKKGVSGHYDVCISDTYNAANKATLTLLDNGEISVDTAGYIQIKDTSFSSASTFKSTMASVQLVYELATPTEITTTPETLTALSGQNNVYADNNGDTEVRFTETIGNELGV